MRRPRRGAVLTAAGATGLLALGLGAGAGLYAALAPATTTVLAATGATTATSEPESVDALYRRSYRGVVDITVTESSTATSPFGFGGGAAQAEGSGFVYDRRGDIVTNDHVVLGAKSISVRLWDGRSFPARLVGADASTDLAIVRITAPRGLVHPLALGDSDAVSVGDPVIAIGSPFGLPETVTSGIVSALHRTIESPDAYPIGDAIQTDAPINHGNSGGPLIDATGQVIGVTSQIESESGGSDGVGFAIPSNTVVAVAAQLIAHGRVVHAYLGVEVVDSSTPAGARIVRALPGTPAARAGLRAGDVITDLAGQAVTDESDLAAVLTIERPGRTIAVRYVRRGAAGTVSVRLSRRPTG